MRYRVRPAFWGQMAVRGIRQRDLADATGVSQQWVSRVMLEPHRTVSEEWARRASRFLALRFGVYFFPATTQTEPTAPQAHAA